MTQQGIVDISLSYFGLRKRTKFTKPWLIADKFQDNQNIFVDSGCQTLNNSKEEKYTDDELRAIGEHYYSWISSNISRIELFSEFDIRQLGTGYLEENRESWRDQLFDKVLPIWNGDDGIDSLHELGERFGRVGISQTTLNGRDLLPILKRIASTGVDLHGLAMTKPDIMAAVPWKSVSSTSWVSPMQYGDTIVWSHNQLKRYPKKMKEQARKKERFAFIDAGFDLEKIMADDSHEMLRVSLWSWTQLVESINKKTTGVTTPVYEYDAENSEIDDDSVGGVVERTSNRLPTAQPRDPSQKRIIPLIDFDYDTEKRKNQVTGEYEDIEVPKLKVRSESMRICDSCFLASKCPAFEENSTCAYDIPIQIRTKEQMNALMNSIVEMQTQRVMFMRMAEDMEGNGADPILSSEIDRLGKLIKTKNEIEQEGFSLTVTAKQQGQMSMVDRIFGDIGNTKPLHELEQVRDVPDALTELGIIDVESEFTDLPYNR